MFLLTMLSVLIVEKLSVYVFFLLEGMTKSIFNERDRIEKNEYGAIVQKSSN